MILEEIRPVTQILSVISAEIKNKESCWKEMQKNLHSIEISLSYKTYEVWRKILFKLKKCISLFHTITSYGKAQTDFWSTQYLESTYKRGLRYFYFCLTHFNLNNLFRSIHVSTRGNVSFFWWMNAFYFIYIPLFLYASIYSWIFLCFFHILAIVNNAAMNIGCIYLLKLVGFL